MLSRYPTAYCARTVHPVDSGLTRQCRHRCTLQSQPQCRQKAAVPHSPPERRDPLWRRSWPSPPGSRACSMWKVHGLRVRPATALSCATHQAAVQVVVIWCAQLQPPNSRDVVACSHKAGGVAQQRGAGAQAGGRPTGAANVGDGRGFGVCHVCGVVLGEAWKGRNESVRGNNLFQSDKCCAVRWAACRKSPAECRLGQVAQPSSSPNRASACLPGRHASSPCAPKSPSLTMPWLSMKVLAGCTGGGAHSPVRHQATKLNGSNNHAT